MKAFLLAAGEGRRLRPLTETLPKCLVPIRGTPLLAIWLELLEQHGVTDVLINVHYLHRRVVEFMSAPRTGPRVVLTYEDQLLGSAGTVLSNRRFVDGESAFFILYADNLTNIDLTAMTATHNAGGTAMTIGVSVTDTPTEKGTVVVNSAGRVVEFAEKALQPKSNLANAGVYVAGQKLFAYMPAIAPPTRSLDFGHDVLPSMVPDVGVYSVREFLMDIGTPEDYTRAQAAWPGLRAATVE